MAGTPACRGCPEKRWQRYAEDLRGYLAKSFAKWQLPDAFVFIEAIPRTSVGKFKKIELREQFANWKWDA